MLQRSGTSIPWDKALPEASLETVAKLIEHGADVRAACDEVGLLQVTLLVSAMMVVVKAKQQKWMNMPQYLTGVSA